MKRLSSHFALPWRYKKQKKEYDAQEHGEFSFFLYKTNGFERAIRKICCAIELFPVCVKNFFFFMKYPFWQPRNVWSGKKYWSFTEYEQISPGWRKAFGKQLSKDLRSALKKTKQLRSFYFLQIKQKWGFLCLYSTATTEEVFDILNYYEKLSIGYCEICGKPARYYKNYGWHTYLCSDCMDKEIKHNKPNCGDGELIKTKKPYRLKKSDIPVYHKNENGEMVKTTYEIDYTELWGLKKSNIKNKGTKSRKEN